MSTIRSLFDSGDARPGWIYWPPDETPANWTNIFPRNGYVAITPLGVMWIYSSGGWTQSSGGAPANAEYLVGAIHASLSAERLVTGTATVSWDLTNPGEARANVPDDAITNAKLRNSAAYSVIGRTGSSAGDPTDIVANEATVLGRVVGGALVFQQVQTVQLAANAVTNVILRDSQGTSVIGRSASGTADPADIVASADNQYLRRAAGAVGFGQIPLTDVLGATRLAVGQPTSLGGGATGIYWRVGDSQFYTGSLALALNGVVQTPTVDYQEQFPGSGTYEYIAGGPPTGSTQVVWYGVGV